jgi:hypothetical protein
MAFSRRQWRKRNDKTSRIVLLLREAVILITLRTALPLRGQACPIKGMAYCKIMEANKQNAKDTIA